MHVVIFGASGRIGSLLVKSMLKRGHEVTAFIYGPDHFKKQDKLHIFRGDVRDLNDVMGSTAKADAVMSALSSWGTPTKDILASGMSNIVVAMEKHGIKRVVSLTGADARDLGDKPALINRLSRKTLGLIAPKVLSDGEEHIRILRASGLDWTVLRSPVMTSKGGYGNARLDIKSPMPWATIHRRDIVKVMCDLTESRYYVKQSPIIHSI